MTDSQLYLVIGIPVFLFAVLTNIIAGVIRHKAVMAQFTSIENRFTAIEARFGTR